MTIKIISELTSVNGVEYVDVETKHGFVTMTKSEVELINALYATGLNELGIKAILALVEKYAQDLEREKTL